MILEKLKQVADAVKGVLLYILAPVGVILAYIFYLRNKVTDLQDQVLENKAEKQLAETLSQKEVAENVANSAEDEYHRIADEYISKQSSTNKTST